MPAAQTDPIGPDRRRLLNAATVLDAPRAPIPLLAAYDTQRIKAVYFTGGGHENLAWVATHGHPA